MENNSLLEYEKFFLQFHFKKYRARYIKVYCNRSSIVPTKIVLYSSYKRKLKYQPTPGEITVCNMFQELQTNTLYFIPDLLKGLRQRGSDEKDEFV